MPCQRRDAEGTAGSIGPRGRRWSAGSTGTGRPGRWRPTWAGRRPASPTRSGATAPCPGGRARASGPLRRPRRPAAGCSRGRESATGATSAGTTAPCRGGASTRRRGRRGSPTGCWPTPGAGSTAPRRSSGGSWRRCTPTWHGACRRSRSAWGGRPSSRSRLRRCTAG